jgi:chemotaxis protein CheD
VGDVYSRKVIYFPDTGKVLLKRMTSMKNTTIVDRDTSYLQSLRKKDDDSKNIELF